MRISDWSSDVCSSDLVAVGAKNLRHRAMAALLDAATERRRLHHRGDAVDAAHALAHRQKIIERQAVPQADQGLLRRGVGADDDHVRGKLVALKIRSEEYTSELKSLMRLSYDIL